MSVEAGAVFTYEEFLIGAVNTEYDIRTSFFPAYGNSRTISVFPDRDFNSLAGCVFARKLVSDTVSLLGI
jgi:hypothetical protein